jgi:hypothetical protein
VRVFAWLLVGFAVLLIVGPVILVQIDRAQCAARPTAQAVQQCRALIPAIGFVPTAIGLAILAFAILLLAIRPPRREDDYGDDGDDDPNDDERPPISFQRRR